ncbi:MAG: type III pantothenate kinase [Gammaproteobacteria bacterium]|jgi:type III pantothenate kinase|nr:type III pantothenate kinase [Gammaproteobacteria bacterium]MBT3860960.1 type III pantothenate kinase [Gammaproteobacteria bacterium]MBT3987187.1 type III pantothenate kinase [Gammaproteobacteria bacterium]MBT4255495.1 type III pantothenate kinase [Gammaproteobacteria bacterium]MBT4581174.1 type III pantothenate kinase [Gammaproteobacteria bacterium]
MILEIDIGNSRIKWRQLDERDRTVADEGHVQRIDELKRLNAMNAQPLMVRMTSVRGEGETEQVCDWVNSKYSLQVSQAKVSKQCGAVRNSYKDVNRMGIDRWLAMLAAYDRVGGPCVIVDGGTALTVDILAADGSHEGGYILPGLRLMRSSLVENTGIELSAKTVADSAEPGHSTEEAVMNGTLAVLLALIEKKAMGSILLLTGGDAEVLAAMLPEQKRLLVPSLVLDGLTIACPYVSS